MFLSPPSCGRNCIQSGGKVLEPARPEPPTLSSSLTSCPVCPAWLRVVAPPLLGMGCMRVTVHCCGLLAPLPPVWVTLQHKLPKYLQKSTRKFIGEDRKWAWMCPTFPDTRVHLPKAHSPLLGRPQPWGSTLFADTWGPWRTGLRAP